VRKYWILLLIRKRFTPAPLVDFARMSTHPAALLSSVEALTTSCTLPAHAHQNSKIRKSSKFNNFTTMGSIEEALADLRLQKEPNILQTARKHKVHRTTLSRRWNNVTGSKQAGYDVQRLLTTTQSNSLKKYINDLTERGLPPTNAMVRNFGAQIAQKQPGPHWVERWLKANKKDLKSGYLTPIDGARKKAESAYYYSLYYELLARKIKEYDIQPQNMYNMDEKGFLIGQLSKVRRIFTRKAYEAGRVKHVMQDGSREWITHIATICADGTSLSPGLIYQAVSGNIQDSWRQDYNPTEQSCFFSSSPTGWTNDNLGYSWLTTLFDRETKAKARQGRDWRLLIVDGHGSHINMRFIDYCHDHRILVAVYPPHSTHRLQPLDISLFAPLATFYSQELNQFFDDCQGFTRLSKRDFFRLFWVACGKAFTPENIQSGWKKTGLHPFAPEVVLDKYKPNQPAEEERPSSSESSNSVLTAQDWKKIERLLKEVVTNVYDKRVQKLNDTIQDLATTNILLQYKIEGYQRALQNEKKKRQRAKPLFHQLAAQQNGYATFFSPKKVQEARDLQKQQQEAKDHEAALKADEKLQRQL
jgi:DDE superfamily endonuclease/Tc5 transposase DNA-binding domain